MKAKIGRLWEIGRKMTRRIQKKSSPAWGFNPAKQQPELLHAWKNFIQTGKIATDIVPAHIAESWVRSRYYGVDPYRISPTAYLSPDKYQKKIEENRGLIGLSTPILENVFKSFGAARYVAALYDRNGYHLIGLAQPEDLRLREKHGFRKGLCFDERCIGTCAFALAKKRKTVTRVIGCENYLSSLHRTAGVYSPLIDPGSKQILGVIAVTGANLVQYPRAESIVIAASTAIENLIESDKARKELFIYSRSLQIAIDFLEDGVIVVDPQGCVYEMNLAARQALGLSREDIRNHHISELPAFAPLKDVVMESLQFPGERERQTELQILTQTYLVQVKGVRKTGDDLLGVLVQRFGLFSLRGYILSQRRFS
jgi:sigma-54 dependent transcriptional regulator, acetoin dehydrogenase operon transcriptional activator AcoR